MTNAERIQQLDHEIVIIKKQIAANKKQADLLQRLVEATGAVAQTANMRKR